MKYTKKQLDAHAISDLLADAESSEKQAKEGPFYPEKGITKESLLKYAKECRDNAEKYKNGGLHNSLMKGKL